MKQRIDAAQLNELTDAQKEKLRGWWKPHQGDVVIDERAMLPEGYVVTYTHPPGFSTNSELELDKDVCLPILSIGQMIEFLVSKPGSLGGDEYSNFIINGVQAKWDGYTYTADHLCDALWDVVRSKLSV